jgi:PTS system beta-glucosides-specific IIC component
MEIKLYAPVNCEVKQLSDCTDDAFKNKFLGDGILIIPESNMFTSPFESAVVKMIFDTKHAYGFDVNGFDVLIHYGLETVSLKGEPFTTPLNLEQKVSKGNLLFEVDNEMIKKNNLSLETPIVFDQTNLAEFKIKNLKPGKYKQGDLIATIEIVAKEKVEPKTNDELVQEIAKGEFELKNFKSKYEIAAEEFWNAVGGKANFSKVYNCMTRVRFNIKNKDIVKQDAIKKNALVKGINWSGSELQIIIGGECYKVREELDKLVKSGGAQKSKVSGKAGTAALTKTRKTISQKLLGVVGGVMIPSIPVLMALGLIGAIYGILTEAKVVGTPGDDAATSPMIDVILYAMYKTALLTIGVYFCYNTVKFLGGNPIMGIMIGLILCSRLLLGTGTVIGTANLGGQGEIPVSPTDAEYNSLHFGEFVSVPFYQLKGFYLFHMGDYPVLIKSYESSIIPFVGAAILYFYIDKWIKTWMPTSIDVCFRHPLAVMATIFGALFIVAPITSLIEFAFLRFFQEASNLPLGLGSALFGTLWMPLVITGTHVAVGLAVALPVYLGHPSALWAATGAAGSGQTGAAIGVALKTKNKNLRSTTWSAVIAAYFGGVSEPMLYGVNIPKVIPFLTGLFASFVSGWLYGLLGVDIDFLGPSIFPLTLVSFTGHLEWLKVTICTLVGYGVGILATLLLYRERSDELKLSKRTFKKLRKLAKLKVGQDKLDEVLEMQKKYLDKVKSKKGEYAKYEKYIQKLIDLENRLVSIQDKEEKTRRKLYVKAEKALLNEKLSPEKKAEAVQKFNNFTLEEKREVAQIKKNEWVAKNTELDKLFSVTMAELEKESLTIENAYYSYANIDAIKVKGNGLWNAIHSVQVGYGYEDAKQVGLTKEEKRTLKELKTSLKNDKRPVRA